MWVSVVSVLMCATVDSVYKSWCFMGFFGHLRCEGFPLSGHADVCSFRPGSNLFVKDSM
jgi:hypothetical protein